MTAIDPRQPPKTNSDPVPTSAIMDALAEIQDALAEKMNLILDELTRLTDELVHERRERAQRYKKALENKLLTDLPLHPNLEDRVEKWLDKRQQRRISGLYDTRTIIREALDSSDFGMASRRLVNAYMKKRGYVNKQINSGKEKGYYWVNINSDPYKSACRRVKTRQAEKREARQAELLKTPKSDKDLTFIPQNARDWIVAHPEVVKAGIEARDILLAEIPGVSAWTSPLEIEKVFASLGFTQCFSQGERTGYYWFPPRKNRAAQEPEPLDEFDINEEDLA